MNINAIAFFEFFATSIHSLLRPSQPHSCMNTPQNKPWASVSVVVGKGQLLSYTIVAKRLPTMGAVIASLPLTSMLVVFWLYRDTKEPLLVTEFLDSMVWIILPSISFFIVFSLLLKKQFGFYLSMVLATVAMLISYALFLQIMKSFNIHI